MGDTGSLAGVVLRVWATPRASPERIGRLGNGCIRAYVAPAPEQGKANARLIALLAKLLLVPRDSIEIISGTKHRRKLVRVAGCGEDEVKERIPPLQPGHYTGGIKGRRRSRRGGVKRARAAGASVS